MLAVVGRQAPLRGAVGCRLIHPPATLGGDIILMNTCFGNFFAEDRADRGALRARRYGVASRSMLLRRRHRGATIHCAFTGFHTMN